MFEIETPPLHHGGHAKTKPQNKELPLCCPDAVACAVSIQLKPLWPKLHEPDPYLTLRSISSIAADTSNHTRQSPKFPATAQQKHSAVPKPHICTCGQNNSNAALLVGEASSLNRSGALSPPYRRQQPPILPLCDAAHSPAVSKTTGRRAKGLPPCRKGGVARAAAAAADAAAGERRAGGGRAADAVGPPAAGPSQQLGGDMPAMEGGQLA